MQLLNLSNLTLNLAGHKLFADLEWTLLDKQRVGLVGPNGSGKSTLLRLIAGLIVPDRGDVHRRRGLTVGYLPQAVSFDAGATLIERAMRMSPALSQIEARLATITAQLADPDVYGDEARLERVLAQQESALEEFERLGGSAFPGRVRSLLAHLGFSAADYDRPSETLSGGERKLVALVPLAIEEPDLLLLDEPDNHLDLDAKDRLEQFIRSYRGTVIVVSHDRYLLDSTVDHIASLAEGKLELFRGNYSAYVTDCELRRLAQQRRYAAQQKEIARIEASIKRFELWASLVVNERHIKQARSRRRALDRMDERGEIVERVRESRRLGLVLPGSRGSKKALEVEGVSMGFGEELVFVDADLLLRHGERVGLVGPNGCGKSVLMKVCIGEYEPLEGRIRIGPSTRLGYYAQEHDTLQSWLDRSPLELIRDTAAMTEGAAVAMLLKYLFRYDQVHQPIRVMSGGERSRLQLARLVLEKPNLLLLDEPTNNLDIPSAEVLEAALDDFEGSLLVVSHDRYFLDRVVDRVVDMSDGSLTGFDGGYTDFILARNAAGSSPKRD
jgi:ATP-binding cassette subfamily F protein 3